MFDLKGKVVVITGASSGIGAELAEKIAAKGGRLVLAARRLEPLEAVSQRVSQRGEAALVVATDVSDASACEHLMERAVAHFGRIDILINNAGISMWARFEEVTDLSAMRRIMEVNYYGAVYCTRYALPHIKAQKGQIVGISSLTGLTGVPTRTFYAASKHAMMGFFDSLRVELMESGVTVSLICPGFVATNISRLDGMGSRAENGLVDDSKVMSVSRCCEEIIAAIEQRRRLVVMTRRGKLGRWLRLIAPSLVDRLAQKAIDKGR